MRYLDPHNDAEFCSRAQLDKWMPVDHYNGGMEHTTRHLIYSRFWYKALFDLGLVPGAEPYAKRTSQGLILAADGRKMSKSLGNAVPSADVVARAGADACRMTILFLAPWTSNANWSEEALMGVTRFLKRVEALSDNLTDVAPDAEGEFWVNDLVAKMTYRIENMQFNTAISAMMEFINAFSGGMPRAAFAALIKVLNPFAPHLAEEMWEKLGHSDMLVFQPWPIYDESKLVKSEMTVVVSVNGKRRAEVNVPIAISESELIEAARDAAEKHLSGTAVIKTIIVPGKMVNFVIKGDK